MNIIIEDNQEIVGFNEKLENIIKKAILDTLKHEDFEKDCEIGVNIVDNEIIKDLNRQHRGIDKPTDVLSFPLLDFCNSKDDPFLYDNGNLMLGDIILSMERALEQSREYGHSLEREVGFLCVHSMLHLLGYDHDTEDNTRIMRKKEEDILSNLGLKRE